MSSLRPMSADLLQEVWTASGRGVHSHTRHHAWQHLASATATPGFAESHASELTKLILHYLAMSVDLKTRRTMKKTVTHCLQNSEDFVKEFTMQLVRLGGVRQSPGKATGLIIMSSLVLRHLGPKAAEKPVIKLIECQASWIAAIDAAGYSRRAAQSAIASSLRSRSEATVTAGMIQLYIKVAANCKDNGPLIRTIWSYSNWHNDVGREDVQTSLLQIYIDQILCAKEMPPRVVLRSYEGLLQSSSAHHIADMILPAAVRMIKRSPEVALAMTAFTVNNLQQDLSFVQAEIFPVLLQQARHARDTVRKRAVEAISAFAAKTKDEAALRESVDAACRVLDGTQSGKIKSVQERITLAAVIECLGRSQACAEADGLASSIVNFLCSMYNDEGTEDGKLALLRALEPWVLRCKEIPAAALDRFNAKSLKEKETLRRGHMWVVVGLVKGRRDFRCMFYDLLPALEQVIAEGCTKAASRADGILALLIAALLAADSFSEHSSPKIEFDRMLSKRDVLPLIDSSTAFSLKSTHDACSMVECCHVLLSYHLIPARPEKPYKVASQTLTVLLLHHVLEVRQVATKAVEELISGVPGGAEHCVTLLNALQSWVDSPASVAVIQKTSDGDVDHSTMISIETVHERYLQALLACTPRLHSKLSKDPTVALQYVQPGLVASLLLLTHHPLVSHARCKGAWQTISKRAGTQLVHELLKHPEHVQELVDIIMERGVCSNDTKMSAAGCGSLHTLATLDAPALLGPVLDVALMKKTKLLDTSAHDAITARQLRIYATPLGRTSNENDDGTKIPQELFEQLLIEDPLFCAPPPFPPQQSEQTLFQNPPDGSPSLAPQKPVGSVKQQSSKPVDPAVQARQRQLVDEAKIRNQVIDVRERLTRGLAALGAFATGDPAFTMSCLDFITAPAISLLTSPLVGSGAALHCLQCCVSCIPGAPGRRSLDLAAALRLVYISESKCEEEPSSSLSSRQSNVWVWLSEQPCVASALQALQLATGGRPRVVQGARDHEDSGSLKVESMVMHPLPAQVYSLCFPLLRAVLRCPRPTPLQDIALSIIALHLPPDVVVQSQKPQAFQLLYGTLAIQPALRDKIQPLLSTLCSGLLSVESAPDLGPDHLALIKKKCEDDDERRAFNAAFQGLASGHPHVRSAALMGLDSLSVERTKAYIMKLFNSGSNEEVVNTIALAWIACSDVNEANAEHAVRLWDELGFTVSGLDLVHALISFVCSPFPDIRSAASRALSRAVSSFKDDPLKERNAVHTAVMELLEKYKSGGRSSSIETRLGVAAALSCLSGPLASSSQAAPSSNDGDVLNTIDFLLSDGLLDQDADVRTQMVTAGVAIVDAAGKHHSMPLLSLLESRLEGESRSTRSMNSSPSANQPISEEQYDHVRQGAVVFLGTLARHLDPKEQTAKITSIIDTLINVLATPSESVQRSVSQCLPPLITSQAAVDASYTDGVVSRLLNSTLKGATYGDRRGAAFGLAGAVKGLGLSSLKGSGIMDRLKGGLEDKGDAGAREGALLAFECLSETMGRLFEPYVIQILSAMLTAFGDPSPPVREAAHGAARVIMGQLSAAGVKLVLPSLLRGLEDKTWRTKQGSIQLLGAMAYCAPKQLSTCLPTIVPRLSQVLADPHPKVTAAAREALDEVGSVIRNPEVVTLVPTLMAAVADPEKANKKALDTLLSTVFVNTIDAASLALIMPIVHRGLKDRSGDVKKRAARIIGNLCKLVNDQRDMAPYVSALLPDIQAALIDPLPEVRAMASKALGALTLGLGTAAASAGLTQVRPWLLDRMASESNAVERSGAAQGLAEVLAVQGAQALEEVLPNVIAGCSANSPAAREGYLTAFKYLPAAMPEVFRPHLPDMLPCVLNGLADEAEGVRDAALAAGRVAVELYATSALTLLLPTVEVGMINGNWRIRQSSVELLGDLLYKVSGATGRIQQDVQDDDTEGISVEAHGLAIIDALGMEKRNDILALLFMARSDVAYTVRSSALHVWKTLVTNTPKTLGEILPALMSHVISGLSSLEEERRESGSRCLGELVRKMGDRVLSQVIPILVGRGMPAEAASTRAGVCEGLREVIENATRQQLAEHMVHILPAVQNALCDDEEEVRAAAGKAMEVLFRHSGTGTGTGAGAGGLSGSTGFSTNNGGAAADNVVPSLLKDLESDDPQTAAQALEGLRVVLSVRPQLLSAMVPRLVKPPHRASALRAVGALVEVAGAAMHALLPTLMGPLLVQAGSIDGSTGGGAGGQVELVEAAREALSSVALSVQEDGLHAFMGEVFKGLDDPEKRIGAAVTVTVFCKSTKLSLEDILPNLIHTLIPLLAENDEAVLTQVNEAIAAVLGGIPKESSSIYVRPLEEAVLSGIDRVKRESHNTTNCRLPGLNGPKTLTPLVPIFVHGVLQSTNGEIREIAARGLGELIECSGWEALKPCVIQIAGPLIRIIGDKFPWQTKAAILKTMGSLVRYGGAALRPFVPQLQTTFVKCLADPARGVRVQAATNLGGLASMALRLDHLVRDVAASAKTADPFAMREGYLMALQGMMCAQLSPPSKLSDESIRAVREAATVIFAEARRLDDETLIVAAAGALGAYATRCGDFELKDLLVSDRDVGFMLGGGEDALPDVQGGHRRGVAELGAAITKFAPLRLEEIGVKESFLKGMFRLGVKTDLVDVKQAVVVAIGRLAIAELGGGGDGGGDGSGSEGTVASKVTMAAFVRLSIAMLGPDQHLEVQKQVMAALRALSLAPGGVQALASHLYDLIPMLLAFIRDNSGMTKISAERTLSRVFGLNETGHETVTAFLANGKPGALAKQMLTEGYIRRLTRLPSDGDDDLSDYAHF